MIHSIATNTRRIHMRWNTNTNGQSTFCVNQQWWFFNVCWSQFLRSGCQQSCSPVACGPLANIQWQQIQQIIVCKYDTFNGDKYNKLKYANMQHSMATNTTKCSMQIWYRCPCMTSFMPVISYEYNTSRIQKYRPSMYSVQKHNYNANTARQLFPLLPAPWWIFPALGIIEWIQSTLPSLPAAEQKPSMPAVHIYKYKTNTNTRL